MNDPANEKFVLLWGRAAEDAPQLEPALAKAGAKAVRADAAAEVERIVDELPELPVCIVVDGEQPLRLANLFRDSRMLSVPVLARVSHPSESAFSRAVSGGADDVLTRHDLGGITRRVATLIEGAVPEARPGGAAAVLADTDPSRRALHGRALRRAGMDVRFASSHDELQAALTGEETPLVVVAHESLVDEREGGHGWIRACANHHTLPVVLLQERYVGERGGHRVERTGWLPERAPAPNVIFLVNELLSSASHDQRSSTRALFMTVCSFRRANELVADYGVTYNISRDGIYLRTLQPLEPGTAVWLEMRPPGDRRAVHLRGNVVWKRLAGGGGGSPPGFAVRVLPQLCPVGDLERYRAGYATLMSPWTSPAEHDAEASPTPAKDAPHPPRVLAADDEPSIRAIFNRVLRELGAEVTLAANGEEAVRAFRAGQYDAVVTDIDMPRLDGIELLKAIRAHDDQIPVLIVTGNPSADTAIEALDHGALRYIVKPFEAKTLMEAIQEALQMGRLAKFRRQAARLVSEERVAEIGDREQLEESLDRALQTLTIVTQPLVDANERTTFAYEVLVRTSEPRIPHPGALFDAAQRLDRIPDVSRRIRELASEAIASTDRDLFVNLHPRDLVDEHLYDAGAPLSAVASRVVLEITERATLDDIGDLRGRVQRLRDLGYRIAVDDLGAGYSGLSTFCDLQPDVAKVDRAGYSGLSTFCALQPDVAKVDMSLVRNIHQRPTKQRLVRSLVEACRDLDFLFIAEGVETAEELATLQQLGCRCFQGYFFARPAPPFPDVVWPE